jgi:hypothetical protein
VLVTKILFGIGLVGVLVMARESRGWAQDGGSGPSSNIRETGGASMLVLTPNEEFANRLKLDRKSQFPEVDGILSAASKEAQPIGVALVQMRQRMLAASMAEPASASDMKVLTDAYREAAFRLANVESAAFARILRTLRPNQMNNAPQAFAYLTGMFYPPAPGRPGGGGGRAGGVSLTRGELLEAGFKLTGPQNKHTKAILDEAEKAAAPTREALIKARAARLAAVQGARQADIDASSRDYAAAATTMTELEMTTFGKVLQGLEPAQRANAGGGLSLMHGMFLDPKRWDDIPDHRSY